MRFPTSDFPVRKKDSELWQVQYHGLHAQRMRPHLSRTLLICRVSGGEIDNFRVFFVGSVLLLQCLAIALTRCLWRARSVLMVDNPEIEPEVELNLPLSPNYPITYVFPIIEASPGQASRLYIIQNHV